MDKIGGIRNFQATDVQQKETSSSQTDVSSTIDDTSKSLDDVLFTTQDGTEITRGDLKNYVALKMALSLTEEIGGAVNEALASIKSDGDDSGGSSDSTQNSTSNSLNVLSKLLKKESFSSSGQTIQDRLDGMSDKADSLNPTDDPSILQAQLEEIDSANKENQKDLSGQVAAALVQSNTTHLKESTNSLNKLIQPLKNLLL